MSKTILLCGDVHGKFSHVTNYVQSLPDSDKPAAVIFLGDLDPQQDLALEFAPIEKALGHQEVYCCRGNHEVDNETVFKNFYGSPIFAERCLDGQVREIAGLRTAFLGGVFRGDVWYPDDRKTSDTDPKFRNYQEYKKSVTKTWPNRLKQRLGDNDEMDAKTSGKLRKHSCTIWPDTFDRLADTRADVLITHEAPGCHPNGFEPLTLLAQSMGVKVSFHGHQHDCLNYLAHYETLGFKPYGVGLRGISELNTETLEVTVVVPGELDTHRMYRQDGVE